MASKRTKQTIDHKTSAERKKIGGFGDANYLSADAARRLRIGDIEIGGIGGKNFNIFFFNAQDDKAGSKKAADGKKARTPRKKKEADRQIFPHGPFSHYGIMLDADEMRKMQAEEAMAAPAAERAETHSSPISYNVVSNPNESAGIFADSHGAAETGWTTSCTEPLAANFTYVNAHEPKQTAGANTNAPNNYNFATPRYAADEYRTSRTDDRANAGNYGYSGGNGGFMAGFNAHDLAYRHGADHERQYYLGREDGRKMAMGEGRAGGYPGYRLRKIKTVTKTTTTGPRRHEDARQPLPPFAQPEAPRATLQTAAEDYGGGPGLLPDNNSLYDFPNNNIGSWRQNGTGPALNGGGLFDFTAEQEPQLQEQPERRRMPIQPLGQPMQQGRGGKREKTRAKTVTVKTYYYEPACGYGPGIVEKVVYRDGNGNNAGRKKGGYEKGPAAGGRMKGGRTRPQGRKKNKARDNDVDHFAAVDTEHANTLPEFNLDGNNKRTELPEFKLDAQDEARPAVSRPSYTKPTIQIQPPVKKESKGKKAWRYIRNAAIGAFMGAVMVPAAISAYDALTAKQPAPIVQAVGENPGIGPGGKATAEVFKWRKNKLISPTTASGAIAYLNNKTQPEKIIEAQIRGGKASSEFYQAGYDVINRSGVRSSNTGSDVIYPGESLEVRNEDVNMVRKGLGMGEIATSKGNDTVAPEQTQKPRDYAPYAIDGAVGGAVAGLMLAHRQNRKNGNGTMAATGAYRNRQPMEEEPMELRHEDQTSTPRMTDAEYREIANRQKTYSSNAEQPQGEFSEEYSGKVLHTVAPNHVTKHTEPNSIGMGMVEAWLRNESNPNSREVARKISEYYDGIKDVKDKDKVPEALFNADLVKSLIDRIKYSEVSKVHGENPKLDAGQIENCLTGQAVSNPISYGRGEVEGLLEQAKANEFSQRLMDSLLNGEHNPIRRQTGADKIESAILPAHKKNDLPEIEIED